MEYIIAPTLFLNKTCRLPGIGTLAVIACSAEHDLVNAQIKAPVPSIVFSATQEADENVFNEFTALSELIKKDIDEKGIVTLKGVGDFIKNEQGAIDFIPLTVNSFFLPTVVAQTVIREHTEHAILVGDKETTSTQMTGYFDETETTKKSHWWIWAIVLGVVGLATIVLYLSKYGFNLFGNVITP
jgi:hypothetical protein